MLLDQLEELLFEQALSMRCNAFFVFVIAERKTSRDAVVLESCWIQGSEDRVLRRDGRTPVRDGRMPENLGQEVQLSRGDACPQPRNGRRDGTKPKRRLADQGVRGHGDLLGVSVEQLKLDRVDLIVEPEVPEKPCREIVDGRSNN